MRAPHPKLLFALPLLAAFGTAQGAGIKCWTNDEGVRECGNAIPPEYAKKRNETLNERGMTVDVQERAKTEEELAAERRRQEEQARREAEAEARRKEQARRDRVLLATFSSVADLKDSRDRKVSAVEASIELNARTLAKLEDKLEGLEQRAARLERKGKPVPEALVGDMQRVRQQIRNTEAFMARKREEKQALQEKYAADIRRFRELTAEEE